MTLVTSLPAAFSETLLQWYDLHARKLPWRQLKTGPDPFQHTDRNYAVWLSEIMLQQTTVVSVLPYYSRFLQRFPTVQALAAADREEVLAAWAGLGYYSRARSLHKAAGILAKEGFPSTREAWLKIPGVGPYTSAALAALLNHEPVVPADGNVFRVTARLFAEEAPLPKEAKKLAILAQELLSSSAAKARPGDFAQSLFDLGATICTKNPECLLCPVLSFCRSGQEGRAAFYPKRALKEQKPEKTGACFVLTDEQGQILLEKRPDTGLLGGLYGFPGTKWQNLPCGTEQNKAAAAAVLQDLLPYFSAEALTLFQADWQFKGQIRHIFTHFSLTLAVFSAEVCKILPTGEQQKLFLKTETDKIGLPSLMQKCFRQAFSDKN